MRSFYDPTDEHLTKLAQPWCASFSGGKDSTSLVTWVEWLRRSGRLAVERPQLVRSDTGVEEANLVGVAEELTALLVRSGWDCGLVLPAIHERLYNRILGIGNSPIHPGITRMRWCTRSTKIDPMNRWRRVNGNGLSLTGLRLGESAMRDGKIKRAACSAGGECGIPDPGEGKYSPILHWKTCEVIDWLNGRVGRAVTSLMADVFAVTAKLVGIYGIEEAVSLFDERQVISSARFGCIGCPAIGSEAAAPRVVLKRNGSENPLNELYDVWFEARRGVNRCFRPVGAKRSNAKVGGYGPIRMEARKRLFERVMDIQRRAGVVLVTPEDEAFIRDCWARKLYPRGWSEADESVVAPIDEPLFETQ